MSAASSGVPKGYSGSQRQSWIIAVCGFARAFMEVLDTSIANVALPHIAGNLARAMKSPAWVLTAATGRRMQCDLKKGRLLGPKESNSASH